MSARVLIVDDDGALGETIVLGLRWRGMCPVWRGSAAEALHALEHESFDVVVTDINMPEMDGLQLCERIVQNRPDVPVVVLTAFGSMNTAIQAIRAAAFDFISKPVDIDALVHAVQRAADQRQLREQVKRLRLEAPERPSESDPIGESLPMRGVQNLIARAAESDATILLSGERGTGKELVARAIHKRSSRRAAPFVAINCATSPESLLEAELFGHARTTNSVGARAGAFVRANKGTLLLDGIGDVPLGLQPGLLRVLQERTVRPSGGTDEVPFDVRVIATTHSDLASGVDAGRFRADLYYYINVVQLGLPPLRARRDDILPLALHFIRECAKQAKKDVIGFSKEAAEKLVAYEWPGNVRELRNAMDHAVALTRLQEICVEDLPEKIRNYRFSQAAVVGKERDALMPLAEVERRYILRVLDEVEGNKAAAARLLRVGRKTLYRKLEGYESGDVGDPDSAAAAD
jgi:two-component system response regulator HydG